MTKKVLSILIIMALSINLLIFSQDDVTATNNNTLALQDDSLLGFQGLPSADESSQAALIDKTVADVQLESVSQVSSRTLTDDGAVWQAEDFSILCGKDSSQRLAGQIGHDQNDQLTTVNSALSKDGHFYAPKNIELSDEKSSSSSGVLNVSKAVRQDRQNTTFTVTSNQVPGHGLICVLSSDNTFQYAEAQFGNNISGNPLIVDGAVVWEN